MTIITGVLSKPRTFGTQQGQCLLELTRRVAPADKVAHMRKNVLLQKLKSFKTTTGQVSKNRSVELKTLHTVRERREELRIIQEHNHEKRTRLEALRESSVQLRKMNNLN